MGDSRSPGASAAGPTEEPLADDLLVRDRELLQRFRAGQREAMAQVFAAYSDVVARYLRSRVAVSADGWTRYCTLSEVECEDLLHETFVRAFAPAARQVYDGLRPYVAYLITIARNLIVDRARAAARVQAQTGRQDEIWAATGGSETPPAEQQIESRQLAEVLVRFRQQLGERERQVFEARYLRQLSQRDCARLLRVGIAVVRRIDVRLRTGLLRSLRELGFLENVRPRIGSSLLPRNKR
jgi:RNA polymerase sigma-70 factor (ECF subfamily)